MAMEAYTAFQIVQTCYDIGKQVITLCQTWRNAHEEVRARVVIVEAGWERSKRQMDFMQKISQIIDDELFQTLDNLLLELCKRLSAALSILETLTNKEVGRWARLRGSRAAYVWKKDALDSLIRELEDWQRRFDPSWFLIMTIANPMVDAELQRSRAAAGPTEHGGRSLPNAARSPLAAADSLRSVLSPAGSQSRSVFLPECKMETTDIRFSDAKLGRLLTGDVKWYIVDTVVCSAGRNVDSLTRDVRDLGAKLSQADPLSFGLLNCKGVMRVTSPSSIPQAAKQASELNIIFRIPEGMDVLDSLRDLLLTAKSRVSLTQKVRIACELARSISYVHTFNFVHKNIRPESILCFEDSSKRRSHTFLVGFDAFRAADGSTILLGDNAWDRNLYRHPDRQGVYAVEKYRMEHDIYSLGVCLLEIGLWESFVEYEVNGSLLQAVAGKWYHRFEAWMTPDTGPGRPPRPHEIALYVKNYLVETARTVLPTKMGDKYADAVVACLTCLDKTEPGNAAAAPVPEDAMATAVQFVEQTVLMLGEITV